MKRHFNKNFLYGPLATVNDLIAQYGSLSERDFLRRCENYDSVTVGAAYKQLFNKTEEQLISDWRFYGYIS